MSSTRITASTGAEASTADRPRPSAAAHVAVGAIAGLAWAAAFRGFMAGLAGGASAFDWYGTYVAILLPGVIAGVGLGWAEYLRRTGGRPHWRWLALSVLAFTVAPLTMPGAFEALFTQGLGGGAIAVPLAALAGGYALARNGPLWARIGCGILAALVLAALAALPFGDATSRLAHDLPRGVWVATLAASCFAVLCIACMIPFRRVDRVRIPPRGDRASG
ncbi:hypothetical protein ACFPPE_16570 [Agromyces tardus]|uniref:hypothetical protein n=1 Tax=Agromyces tardus TaxID=2583849 RepID=UPI001FE9BD15|nr:hypothetical protein [Agromyces tardus]